MNFAVGAPGARVFFKHAGADRPTLIALTVGAHMPCRKIVPIPPNQSGAASGAESALALRVDNVAGINIIEARVKREFGEWLTIHQWPTRTRNGLEYWVVDVSELER